MSKPINITDLPAHLRRQVEKQLAAEQAALPPTTVKPISSDAWQGKEPCLQLHVEKFLHTLGFAKRTRKMILATGGQGGALGWQVHVSRAIGNPYLLDILLLGRDGRYLEIELKTAKGRLSDVQSALVAGLGCQVCRSLEDVKRAVQLWINCGAAAWKKEVDDD